MPGMDVVLKLRELRRMKKLTQKDVAEKSGIGEKTISSFETGNRIGSLKVSQLERLLRVYGMAPSEFFGCKVERESAPWEMSSEQQYSDRLAQRMARLPKSAQRAIAARIELMLETAGDLGHYDAFAPQASIEEADWRMMTSRN